MSKQADKGVTQTIEIWINNSNEDKDWSVSAVRLDYGQHSRQMGFEQPHQANAVLAVEIMAIIAASLEDECEEFTFHDPDLMLALPGLTLSGLLIACQPDEAGVRRALLRFERAIGHLPSVLLPAFQDQQAAALELDGFLIPAVQDLLGPAIEIFDHILEHGFEEEDMKVLKARLKTMRARRDQLSDYVGLLRGCARKGALPTRVETPSADGISLTGWTAGSGIERRINTHALWGHHEKDRLSA